MPIVAFNVLTTNFKNSRPVWESRNTKLDSMHFQRLKSSQRLTFNLFSRWSRRIVFDWTVQRWAVGARRTATRTFGGTLNAVNGTNASLQVLVIKGERLRSPATECLGRSRATLVRRLQAVAANDAGYLAALVVVFIGSAATSERRFIDSQAGLMDTAQALGFAFAAAGEIIEVKCCIRTAMSKKDVRHGDD